MKINNCPSCGAAANIQGLHLKKVVCSIPECSVTGRIKHTEEEAISAWNSLRGPASEQKAETMNVRLQVAAMIVAETYRHTAQRVELVAPSIFKEVDALIKAERETREVAK